MLSSTEQDVVASFVAFLREKVSSGSLNESECESVEVALQCLESSFSLPDDRSGPLPPILHLVQEWQRSQELSPELEAQAERLKEEGNGLMKTEKYDQALEKYSEALSIKESPVYLCNRAAAYTKLERYTEAVADCRKALVLDPRHAKAYGRLGLVYSCQDKHREAADCYRKALEIDCDNASYRNNLSVAEGKLGSNSEQQSQSGGLGGNPFAAFAGGGGGGGGLPDMSALLNNPAMMNLATQLMSDPNVQNFMGSVMTNASNQPGGAASMGALLEAGQRLASQMQQQNPDLVENLRRQFQGDQNPGGGPGDSNRPPPPSDP